MPGKIKNDDINLSNQESIPELYTKEKIQLHNLFFDRLISELKLKKTNGDIVAVLHILPDAIPFTRDKICKIWLDTFRRDRNIIDRKSVV